MLLSLYFPVACNPSRAVTLPNIGVPHYIGVPHRVTYPSWQVYSLAGGPTMVPFATNGCFIVTGSDAGHVKIWNAETGAEVRSMHGVLCQVGDFISKH